MGRVWMVEAITEVCVEDIQAPWEALWWLVSFPFRWVCVAKVAAVGKAIAGNPDTTALRGGLLQDLKKTYFFR